MEVRRTNYQSRKSYNILTVPIYGVRRRRRPLTGMF